MSLDVLKHIPGLQNLPVRAPPPGVVPNFVDPVSRRYEVYVTAGICLPILALFAVARLYVKVLVLKTRTKDDCESSTFLLGQALTGPQDAYILGLVRCMRT